MKTNTIKTILWRKSQTKLAISLTLPTRETLYLSIFSLGRRSTTTLSLTSSFQKWASLCSQSWNLNRKILIIIIRTKNRRRMYLNRRGGQKITFRMTNSNLMMNCFRKYLIKKIRQGSWTTNLSTLPIHPWLIPPLTPRHRRKVQATFKIKDLHFLSPDWALSNSKT